MKLHFNANDIKELLEHSRAAEKRSPTYAQMFEGAYRFDGKNVNIESLEDLEDWPQSPEVNPKKLPPGLCLVGDQGVYFMSNATLNLRSTAGASYRVAKAFETDSKIEPDQWYNNKVASFGGDDGTEFATEAFLEGVLRLARDGVACVSMSVLSYEPAIPDASKVRRFGTAAQTKKKAAETVTYKLPAM